MAIHFVGVLPSHVASLLTVKGDHAQAALLGRSLLFMGSQS